MLRHAHKFTIADEDAVRVLVSKFAKAIRHEERGERLLRAGADADRHYRDSSARERRAFFHGLLTGYAVALKIQVRADPKSA